jgi:hypothetical protein
VIFPDFKYVEQVPISREGASSFYKQHLEPSLGRSGAKQATLKSWVLPYKAVILLCPSSRIPSADITAFFPDFSSFPPS